MLNTLNIAPMLFLGIVLAVSAPPTALGNGMATAVDIEPGGQRAGVHRVRTAADIAGSVESRYTRFTTGTKKDPGCSTTRAEYVEVEQPTSIEVPS